MAAAAIFVLIAVGALLVPDLRAEPATWVISGILIALAMATLTVGRDSPAAILSARQVKFARWWGYTSHDGRGERDIREKRGEKRRRDGRV